MANKLKKKVRKHLVEDIKESKESIKEDKKLMRSVKKKAMPKAKKASRAIKTNALLKDTHKESKRAAKELMKPLEAKLFDQGGYDNTDDVDRVAKNEKKALKVSYKQQKKAKKAARNKK